MIPTLVVFAYLGVVLYIGIFASRRQSGVGGGGAEDYFLAGRSLGPTVFLLSLFGTNMTAFTILGSAGHAFSNGIVTFGLMASASALIIPVSLFLVGPRLWAVDPEKISDSDLAIKVQGDAPVRTLDDENFSIPHGQGAWIEIGGAAVRLYEQDWGVQITSFVAGYEMDEPLGSIELSVEEINEAREACERARDEPEP